MSSAGKAARVAIIGAGPAGLFAAKQLAEDGIEVALFNRDIKPGGLAEYGIYPAKTKIKDGLRSQFREILKTPGINYFGNTPIGKKFPLGLADLKKMGFSAILIAAGAQGTKWLGLPGENCAGVYHAKELVYHYNHLPPYAGQSFTIGKKVAVVGVGNVMTDIVRYLCTLPQVEEITTVARRGLAEVKFDRHELEPIIGHLDWLDFQAEVERIAPAMKAVGQEPNAHIQMISERYQKTAEKSASPIWRLRFLSSPVKILCPADGKVWCLRTEENELENIPGGVKAKGTGKFAELDVDTVIFAIGDRVDDELGLPIKGYGFALNNQPRFPMNGSSFELDENAKSEAGLEGVFVCGWSRIVSAGMVGIARKDGVNAARVIQEYLADQPETASVQIEPLEMKLQSSGYTCVTLEDLNRLEVAEKKQAELMNQDEFFFDSNEEMLKSMGLV